MSKVPHRDISILLQKLRNFLLGRPHISALRFEDIVATRSPPPPELPDGPCHKLSANYYCVRDVRREVKPPALIASNRGVIEATGTPAEGAGVKKLPTPGSTYQWD